MKRRNWERCFSRMALSYALLTALLLGAASLSAQTIVYTKENIHEIPENVHTGSKISELKYDPKLIGSNFLNEEWRMANIYILGDTIRIEDVPARMDLSNGVLEVKVGDQIMVVPSYKIDKVEFAGWREWYRSRSGINLYGPTGFYKVLYDGKSQLYCHYSTRIRESNYNVALDKGRKDDEIVIVETYYLMRNGKLIELESKKKKLIEQLGGSKLEQFIRDNGINLKEDSGMIAIAEYLDGKRD